MYGLTPFDNSDFGLFNAFREFEKDFFGASMPMNTCRTDIREEDGKYVMEAELPGFNKEDINIDIDGSQLVITAEHKTENDQKDENGKYIRRERSYGAFKRSFDIPDVDTEKINAEYKNGVLQLELPKKQIQEPTVKRLEIK